ncbi:MAG: ADP-ribosylglycohydrolase family protein [Chloroflexi bacterium]|nr:ADP-ribosylglycohydrolase family protein [Chloroflexota bacterium]
MGNLTSRVLALFGGSHPRRLGWGELDDVRQPMGMAVEDASREAWDGRNAGNGALMRCAPIAVRWRDDAEALARNSVISAVPTHWDRRCGWSCVALNFGIASVLRGETIAPEALIAAAEEAILPSLPELSQYGYEAGMPHGVRIAVARAAELEIDDIEFDGWDMGFTLLALQAGLISLWQAPDFEHGLRAVFEAGGDTDTNGAVAGAVLGARFGIGAIPQRGRDRIAELRQGRTPVEEYADMLTAAREDESKRP